MPSKPSTAKTLAAFAVIYLVWGSTFLAIRIGVQQVPPTLFAAARFFTAGLLLGAWKLARRQTQPPGERDPFPTRMQWASIALQATLIFVINYGLLFWAERRVASGVAAVMMATIPAFTALAEITILGTQRLTLRLAGALVIGLLGVAALVSHSLDLGGSPISAGGAIALLASALSWSVASALTRKLPLPSSKIINSSAQMLLGGIFLFGIAAALGDLRHVHPLSLPLAVWLALAWLIAGGSILGFTVYLWLIGHESPTRVGTYAYVNPLVAVLLGTFLASEAFTRRTLLGTLCVLVSVIVITTTPKSTSSTLANNVKEGNGE
jgi:drug/metabolite transporter (DMT)-like permease